MSCSCDNRKLLSELDRVSELAKKAAVLDGCIYCVYLKPDGTYAFDKKGIEINGVVIEYKHYL